MIKPKFGVGGLLCLVLTVCHGEQASAPGPDIGGPKYTMACYLSTSDCSRIQAGINHLKSHPDSRCSFSGLMLEDLYNAPSGGFAAANPQSATEGMYVIMWETGGSPSGWTNIDNTIYVASISHFAECAGGMLAHEYEHILGNDAPDHYKGTAWSMQNLCSSVQPTGGYVARSAEQPATSATSAYRFPAPQDTVRRPLRSSADIAGDAITRTLTKFPELQRAAAPLRLDETRSRAAVVRVSEIIEGGDTSLSSLIPTMQREASDSVAQCNTIRKGVPAWCAQLSPRSVVVVHDARAVGEGMTIRIRITQWNAAAGGVGLAAWLMLEVKYVRRTDGAWEFAGYGPALAG